MLDFSDLSLDELNKQMIDLSRKLNVARRTNSAATQVLEVYLESIRFELQARMRQKLVDDIYKKVPVVTDSDPELNEKNQKPKPVKSAQDKKREKITQNNPFQKTSTPTSGEY